MLRIGGISAAELAKRYGTPLYVMDEDIIRENCRAFKRSIDEYYDGRGKVVFASKAFNCLEICRIVASEGLGVDVASIGELYTAVKAPIDARTVYFHGNNKTVEELTYAVNVEVGCVVIDNVWELRNLSQIAARQSKTMEVMFRIKPGIDAHTHDYVLTGNNDSKFGFSIDTGEAIDVINEAKSLPGVAIRGIHCHIGSQIFDVDPFEYAGEVMFDLLAEIRKKTGISIKELNLGGGFGIRYTDEDTPTNFGNYMKSVSEMLKKKAAEHNTELPYIVIEPGRSIVGAAGTTLYTVGAVKEIPGVRTYVITDGGMTDNPRYALYKAKYEMQIANKSDAPKDTVVTVAGKTCESGDLLGEGIELQKPEYGDILAVSCTGAYNYSMASNYNRLPRPAVVMVSGGESRVVVKRELVEDLIRNDI